MDLKSYVYTKRQTNLFTVQHPVWHRQIWWIVKMGSRNRNIFQCSTSGVSSLEFQYRGCIQFSKSWFSAFRFFHLSTSCLVQADLINCENWESQLEMVECSQSRFYGLEYQYRECILVSKSWFAAFGIFYFSISCLVQADFINYENLNLISPFSVFTPSQVSPRPRIVPFHISPGSSLPNRPEVALQHISSRPCCNPSYFTQFQNLLPQVRQLDSIQSCKSGLSQWWLLDFLVILMYHTWNPQISTSGFPSFISFSIQDIGLWNREVFIFPNLKFSSLDHQNVCFFLFSYHFDVPLSCLHGNLRELPSCHMPHDSGPIGRNLGFQDFVPAWRYSGISMVACNVHE